MSNEDLTPVPLATLADDKQIRAYIHPTRMIILELLGREKQSVSGVARHLGVHPANLTHHFKLLEKTGLIKLVEKRDTGKNLEKFYRAVAYHFAVDRVGGPPANKQALVLSILRDNLTVALQSLRRKGDEQAVLGVLLTLRLIPEDVTELQQSLAKLLEEFSARRTDTGAIYTLNLSIYPGETEQLPANEVIIREDD